MNKFIQLTNCETNKPVIINTEYIIGITEFNNKTEIKTLDYVYYVSESIEEVKRQLENNLVLS